MREPINARTRLRSSAANLPLDAKRVRFERGAANWFPYYAGYSLGFARNVFGALRLPVGATVLDPWNGVGTTTQVADELGYRAIGFDINPVPTLVANARLARLGDVAHAAGLMGSIAGAAASAPSVGSDDPLLPWLNREHVRVYRAIESGLLANLATDAAGHTLNPSKEALPPLAAFLTLALMRAAKGLAGVRKATNPTWAVPSGKRGIGRIGLVEVWRETVREMLADLSNAKTGPASAEAQIADSRSLPLSDNSVDFVLTSPPYCTRIDYVVSTAFELAAMRLPGESDNFDSLRRQCMGTPLARKNSADHSETDWPRDVGELLKAVRQHPSKASNSYYYKTYQQYFSDTRRSLSELARVLRPGGAAALVVQSSYYKEIYVDLPRLYVSLAEESGLSAEVVDRTIVRRTLSQINVRSSKHLSDKSYSEAVVCLEKSG